jgi:hypothetical protein
MKSRERINTHRHLQWIIALETMFHKEYWNKANTIEFLAFVIKGIIIIPGLLLGVEVWWFYILALVSSIGLIWSSTVKTIPTLIWFNILWSVLAILYLVRYWYA